MSDRCMERREMSPGGREMVTSGGERGGNIKTVMMENSGGCDE